MVWGTDAIFFKDSWIILHAMTRYILCFTSARTLHPNRNSRRKEYACDTKTVLKRKVIRH